VVSIAIVLQALPAAAAPFAWLAHQSVDRAGRMDLATHETVSVTVGSQPLSTAASLDGLRAYTINYGDPSVSVIDAQTVSVITTVPLPSIPASIAVRADGAKAYVPLFDGTVAVLNTATNTVTSFIPLGSFISTGAIATNAAGTRAYIPKYDGSVTSVAVLDTVTDSFTADVFIDATGSFPLGVAVSTDGTRAYATAFGSDLVYVIDATTNLQAGTVTLSGAFGSPQPVGLALNASGTRLYVTEQAIGRLAIVDTTTSTELTSVAVGSSPFTVDLTPDGSRAYVVNGGDSSLSIVDTASSSVIGTVLTVNEFPSSGERFIAPGATTAPPVPPVLSAAALACQKRIGISFKRFGAKAHVTFASCFGRMLADVASGAGTVAAGAACRRDLDPAAADAKINRLRDAARAQILGDCTGVTPSALALPCDPGAATIADTVACVLDAQVAHVTAALADEYAGACGIATAAGLEEAYPRLCGTP
jgi:YVTN family beta-propeller protein